jgi:hypothetical protein
LQQDPILGPTFVLEAQIDLEGARSVRDAVDQIRAVAAQVVGDMGLGGDLEAV